MISPVNNYTTSINNPVYFQWGTTTNASEYSLIFYDQDGEPYGKTIPGNYQIKGCILPEPGQYFWRVFAYDSDGAIMARSALRSIVITNASTNSSSINNSISNHSNSVTKNLNDLEVIAINQNLHPSVTNSKKVKIALGSELEEKIFTRLTLNPIVKTPENVINQVKKHEEIIESNNEEFDYLNEILDLFGF
ncbi:MAG: hypothetical protein LBJ67_11230 [Planctomycetaceae bacterium]|nr:hypothetical protein [Planctomycetaceae bacterium]